MFLAVQVSLIPTFSVDLPVLSLRLTTTDELGSYLLPTSRLAHSGALGNVREPLRAIGLFVRSLGLTLEHWDLLVIRLLDYRPPH